MEETYSTVNNPFDLFAAGMIESNSSEELLGTTLKCIIGGDLKDGDSFFLQKLSFQWHNRRKRKNDFSKKRYV